MNASTSLRLVFVALSFTALAACAAPTSDSPAVEGDDATSAAPTTFEAQIPGFSLWVNDVVQPTTIGSATAWLVQGKTSKTLSGVSSFSPDGDLYGQAQQLSARTFSITIDTPTMEALVEGTPLELELDVAGGKPVYAELTFGARLEHFSGSSKLYALETVAPVRVGDAVHLRGSASVGSGVSALSITAGGAPLALTPMGTHAYAFDLAPSAFLADVRGAAPVVELDATYASAPVQKLASMELRLTGIHVSADTPDVAFPAPACDDDVAACLAALPSGQADTGACGTATEVDACDAP
ncbi:MAG TPA: hypothetical protein VGM56_28280 [Byssovorax sp.]|jgi:hypothetical protein